MDSALFPWRPLGELLVERDYLTADRLERALAEQRRTGRMLGAILVEAGYLTASELARALAEQHGVELRGPGLRSNPYSSRRLQGGPEWRPLGPLLVEQRLVSKAELDDALDAQRRRPELRLGEILVLNGSLSGQALAATLALQHGIALAADALDSDLDVVVVPASPDETVYDLHAVAFNPDYRAGPVLYRSLNLLEVSEFALEYIQEHEPAALEIQRARGDARETVWTYSEARANAQAASRQGVR